MTKPDIKRVGKFSPRAKRYVKYCDDLRMIGVWLPDSQASITFLLPMPKSWGKKKKEKMNMTKHQQTPDLKNLLAAVEDATRGKYAGNQDDRKIWHYSGQLCIHMVLTSSAP